MPIPTPKPLNFPMTAPGRRDIANLHKALQRLKIAIGPEELRNRELGPTTQEAIRAIQNRAGVRADGKMSPKTIDALRDELAHVFYTTNKTRTERLHTLLERLRCSIEKDERQNRFFGQSTEKAVKTAQKKAGLSQTGRVTEKVYAELERAALKARFETKTQVANLHRILGRVARIAKLTAKVSAAETKSRKMGATTKAVILAFQAKYALPKTGALDPTTYERMASVAASRTQPVTKLTVKSPDSLKLVTRVLRLNMVSEQVGDLQRALAFFGYRIDRKEFDTRTFGGSTREAVTEFQRTRGLPITGHAEQSTLKLVNAELRRVNPDVAGSESKFRVRGSVRDAMWIGRPGIKVQVLQKSLRGDGPVLGCGKTLANGFYDVPYDPPRNPVNGQVKLPFHVRVRISDAAGAEMFPSKVIFNPPSITWANFTEGTAPYRGMSEFDARMKAASKALDGVSLAQIGGEGARQEIAHIAQIAGAGPEDIARLVLSHLVAQTLADSSLQADVVYAFVRQNLPPTLKSDLLGAIDTGLEALVEETAQGIVFMEQPLQAAALDNAARENLIPIGTSRARPQILAALDARRRRFALQKPLLTGDGSLEGLLDASAIAAATRDKDVTFGHVATAFLRHRGFHNEFWTDLESRPQEFGGPSAVADFKVVTQLGEITKHHAPTLAFLRNALKDPARRELKSLADCAKLTHNQWVGLINDNGGQVPESITVGAPGDPVGTYAASLVAQSERLFPAVAMVAEVKRGEAPGLARLDAIETLFDAHPDIDLKHDNLDQFARALNTRGEPVDSAVLAEIKVLQRIHRITPSASVARAVLAESLHHAAQILFLGRERFAKALMAQGVDRSIALTVFGYAEFQYAQALARVADLRYDLHRVDPKAIVSHTYTPDELKQYLGEIPNLETLFGSLDFCECTHCRSMYGPAAYLADVLRFLDHHDTSRPNISVRDVLLDRRPDIGGIKLNCDNTNTPLPYIDLVCEILEGAVPDTEMASPGTQRDFSHQTTRTAVELQAFPEYVRASAYRALRMADYPMDVAFDLWQEDARIWLDHLGVPRHVLMKAFRPAPAAEGSALDVSIAGEAFGISSHELMLVITGMHADAIHQNRYWGFDCTVPNVCVKDFLAHTKLAYPELLELVQVRWINAPGASADIRVDRPSCDLSAQKVINLTLKRFDRIHRFLRLWRRTGWKMWELDLLIRTPRIGNDLTYQATVIKLHQFREVQERLGLPFEVALAFYHHLNTEVRIQPDDTTKLILPLYNTLFQNVTLMDPPDPDFALDSSTTPPTDLVNAGTKQLADHKAALLAALAVSEADLLRLIDRTDGRLTLANLTRLHNHVALAKGLKLTIERLLMLEDATGVADVFSTPGKTLSFLDAYEWVTTSGLDIGELDYVLNHRPDSPHGLREEAIQRVVESLRESLRGARPDQMDGPTVASLASALQLPLEHTKLVLQKLELPTTSGPVQALLKTLQPPELWERTRLPDGNEVYKVPSASAESFPDVYRSIRLLHKVSLILRKQKVTNTEDLTWILEAQGKFGTLELAVLPVDSQPASALFGHWLALRQYLNLRTQFPEPEGATLRGVFDAAGTLDSTGDLDQQRNALYQAINALTQWPVEDIAAVHTALQLSYTATRNDYVAVETYVRLAAAFKIAKRLGVAGAIVAVWAIREDQNKQETIAQQIREAAKAKYDYETWLRTAAPLMGVLREKKRTALVRYLVERSQRTEPETVTVQGVDWANGKYWKDADDLLRYFLINVEMSACQLTSRIKQAISSVQMFVQRCFLNLEQPEIKVSQEEKDDNNSFDSWRQWRHMKSYRVWEAARKVFLYPESFILPELRDDKSPFFKELEEELLQGELTNEHAEAAFLHYLQKLDEVARLEIVGVYHEVDDDNPGDDLPPTTDVLHVLGRTKADPAVYYYRRFDLNYGTWDAWEKVDVDITGDHALPVVYNRRLHIFWLVFTEKPQKTKKLPPAEASSGPRDSPDAPTQLELQLAWCARKDNGWTSKQVSREKLIHPWPRPAYSYHLKPRYKSRENLLWLDVYISTSPEFNDTLFHDPFKMTWPNRARLTVTPFEETGLPWHSSSFVFDGAVLDVKMKGLTGRYYILDESAGMGSAPRETASRNMKGPAGRKGIWDDIWGDIGSALGNVVSGLGGSAGLKWSNSYDYVHGGFGAAGRSISPLAGVYEIAPRLSQPDGMHYQFNRLVNNKVQLNDQYLNVLEHRASRSLLRMSSRRSFELLHSPHQILFDTAAWGAAEPLIFQDPYRAFFIRLQAETAPIGYNQVLRRTCYRFFPFYHPYTGLFLREFKRLGPDGLLKRSLQRTPENFYPGNTFDFVKEYGPLAPSEVDDSAARDVVDFQMSGAFGLYNMEVFLHAPLSIACQLSQNQRFEEAMRWFHYIFDPTNVDEFDAPQRFWITKPFFDQNADAYRKQRIENLLTNLGVNLDQVRAWKNDPFNPHKIARHRPIAYQKMVVMKYIDNLIAWGDQLFHRDTIEAINEATTLYVLAYELLGRRPVRVPSAGRRELTYEELVRDGNLDPLGNKSITAVMENCVVPPESPTRTVPGTEPLPLLDTLYFCIPPNEALFSYWNTVEDRLFKIRHCMNIQGVVRQLPLFEPPIDPMLLVKAAAAGVDIGSVLSDTDAPAGHYRFRQLVAKAAEYCNDVRALGDKLLSVLERKDAEELSLLRSAHEIKLQEAMRRIRKAQIEDAEAAIAALEESKKSAEQKRDYYTSREFMNPGETTALALSGVALGLDTAVSILSMTAGATALIPDVTVGASGFGGSPHVVVKVSGGEQLSASAGFAAQVVRAIISALDRSAAIASTVGSYARRQEEWDFQGRLSETEIGQITRQLEGARLRQSVAEYELENLELQIEQTNTVDEYLRSKYTNQQLYDWMLRQITTVYFQAYKHAFDMARRAEKALRFELGRPDASFIEFGYWDGLKKGLLSAERLSNDIRRMEAAYLEQNTRELELTKHVSLSQCFPLQLLELKTNGATTVRLPEWLFDMDFPGHFRRRIKSVSITIPCVVGPYSGVHCTLTLTRHGTRITDNLGSEYGDPLAGGDQFVSENVPVLSIATSHGQNDAGLFELNFNDERYLPFEGAGVVSEWGISLPKESNAFDLGTISDVVLHVRYTAAAGGPALVTAAQDNLKAKLPDNGVRLFDLKSEFGNEWYRFLHPNQGADQILVLSLKPEHLPFYARNMSAKVKSVDLFLDGSAEGKFEVRFCTPGSALSVWETTADSQFGNVQGFSKAVTGLPNLLGDWTFMIKREGAVTSRELAAEDIRVAVLLIQFQTT